MHFCSFFYLQVNFFMVEFAVPDGIETEQTRIEY